MTAKNKLLLLCIISAASVWTVTGSWAQQPGQGFPPGPPPDKPEKGGMRRQMQSHPFLMAGDPRCQKMLLLARTRPEQVRQKLSEWPEYQKLDEDKRNKMVGRLQEFRERIRETAMEEAGKLGLNVPAARKEEFVQRYWSKQIAAETPIRLEAEEKFKAAMQKLRDELKKEF